MSRILRNKFFQLTGCLTASMALFLYTTTVKAKTITSQVKNEIVGLKYLPQADQLLTPGEEPARFNTDNGTSNDLINTEKHITCYPNPAISYINFKFDNAVNKNAKLFIFSFTGRQMEEIPISGNIIKISLDKYFRGLYVYQLRDKQGAILESGKFQVKN